MITAFAGTGFYASDGDGGLATAAFLEFPDGVAVDRNDNVYVADRGGSKIREIPKDGRITSLS